MQQLSLQGKLLWIGIAILGAYAFGGIALNRGESINSAWIVTAAVCTYLLAYRFYSAFIAARVLSLDATRATPAERINDGRDFVPTNRWVVFGHHFAAIAGPGPLIGPTLAAQFGYLPGTLWILVGAVLGGCVQDMVILFSSLRRGGKSLGQMAKDELGLIGGIAALAATLIIMVILISVLGLVVVKALIHSPWGTFTVASTFPVAMLVGIHMHKLRPGRVLEASVIGVVLLLAGVFGGQYIHESTTLAPWFDHDGLTLAWCVIIYGLLAAILPVWLLLAPRDYLSTFLKLGTIFLLAVSIIVLRPEMHMPPLTQFIDGTGPVFSGTVFPFVFITIACGAISGFHALISSGTTPKILSSERDVRMIGYGSMLLESFVAIMAMIAACVLQPGVFFAINSPAAIVGATPELAVATITSWGFPVTTEQMAEFAKEMGETTLFARTGGAPSLAVGMASLFASTFGQSMLAVWYHFAIMFEAVFILTTLDAGTRVGRFMLQDMLGNIIPALGRTTWYPSIILCSSLVVLGWGYFLYVGVIDPKGGINILWPLFGIANQLLAGIALCVATGILVKTGRGKYALITFLPLVWLSIITTSAVLIKSFHENPAMGFFSASRDWEAKALAATDAAAQALAHTMSFNQALVGVLALFFLAMFWLVFISMVRTVLRYNAGKSVLPSSESPYQKTLLGA